MSLNTKSEEGDPQVVDFWSALEALPYLSFGNQDLTDNEVRESIYKGWQDYIRLAPDVLYESLTKDLPEGTNCALVFTNQGASLCLSQPVYEEADADSITFTYSRDLSIEDNKLISTNADIQVRHKNNNLGRVLQRNMIGTLRDIGCTSLSATANNVGGYAWAKMGYIFNEAATSDSDKQQFVSLLRERFAKVQTYLPAEMAQKARKNIGLVCSRDINALADLDFSLNATLKDIFEAHPINACDALDNLFIRSALSFMHEMTDDYLTQDSQKLWQKFNDCGQDYTLGKYLLLKTHWNSFLDFSNKTQVKRVEAYLGL